MIQTGLSFGILVIVIYLLFAVCNLEFFSELRRFFIDQTGRPAGQRQA
jgi:hypothetical protein